ncbi:MAG: hypothetical protein ABI596_14930, partial [Pyrinomonadaceae bacterium]
RWPGLRFARKFWEFYLSSILRGKELQFEFEVVKKSSDRSGGSENNSTKLDEQFEFSDFA